MKPGRNDPCCCGSGKKFKKCCHDKFEVPSTLKVPAKRLAPLPAECNQLVALFNAGRYVELEGRTRLLAEQYPDSGFVWHILGTSLQAQGKEALFALQKATELLPDDAGAHINLGNALHDLGRYDDAVQSFLRALEIKPDFAEAHVNLGNALQDLGRLEDAAQSYRRALQIKPDFATAHCHLGYVLKDLGRLDDAMVNCLRALEIRPNFAEAHVNLGNALQELGRLDDAVQSFNRALQNRPNYAEAHCNLGNALQDLGRLEEALQSYRQALRIRPNYAEAHCNLGNVLKNLGRFDDAVKSYRQALQIKPDYAEAHCNLGNVLQTLGLLDEALQSCRQALEIKPDFAEAHSNLLFFHGYRSDQPAALLLAEARRFGDLAARQARPYTEWRNIPESNRSLRLGLVSGDLRNHPVGYFVESVLAALASNFSSRLEIIAYSNSRSDALTERIKACCYGWHSTIGLSDEVLARQIRDDGIDILIDLSGHTARNRLSLFAWKPAPVQVSWLGYFATTGVAAMDYLIADSWVVPEGEEAHFTEEIYRLPETYLCFTPPDVDVRVSPLPAISNGYITFGCFNNLTKMNDAVVILWARVLQAIPGSRLFLKNKQLDENSVRSGVVNRFAVHGIESERLILEGHAPRAELLAAYQRVDIALDPFPYPGGTTSVEALWMGTPVLTLGGGRFLSRIGESVLQNAGLPDWIAKDPVDYVARAVSHSRDLNYLAALRNGLRHQVLASPLFDATRFARHFEAALRDMWTRWCNQQQGQSS